MPTLAISPKLTPPVTCSEHVSSDHAWALADRVEGLDTIPSDL